MLRLTPHQLFMRTCFHRSHPALFLLLMLITFGQSTLATNSGPVWWQDKERELRYVPDGEAFVNTNGKARFSRAIYGTNTGFRFETSDYPEFGLYMPNFGGSVYLAVQVNGKTTWIKDLATVSSRFVSGLRTYDVSDPTLLGQGHLLISALAHADRDGLLLKVESKQLPADVKLLLFYGGANDRRFSRSGDIGADPVNSFYIEPDKCKGNQFSLGDNRFTLTYGKAPKSITGVFDPSATLTLVDGSFIDNLHQLISSKGSDKPLLMATLPLGSHPLHVSLHTTPTESNKPLNPSDLATAFENGQSYRAKIAGRVKVSTPDPFLNTLGGILAGAEDAIWEAPCYLHGAIGWRTPLTGWRGAYVADVFGLHDRARTHFQAYGASQVTQVPVTLPHLQDETMNLARAKKAWGTPMYSNGYITRAANSTSQMHHYDMNLVYVDALLWHLNWTGDLAYAREVFPLLQRHLAWEKNTYDPDNDALYDGYCCIWASDGLQYNGGVSTHSTAYNYRANKITAEVARLIGEDPTPYQTEADRILTALNKTLWLPGLGWWAEFKDNMGLGMHHTHAAVWTIYHAIDSDVHDPFKAYQATRYIDEEIPHIPVHAKGLNEYDNQVVATTDWQPYMWSINNVAFAEIAHTALAYWQAGRPEKAYQLYKGALLDAMYLGSGPGNITQVSFYDAARGETYRDFADPVAMASRVLVQGLFGLYPDLLHKRLVVRPGFPADWNYASLETANMTYRFRRQDKVEHHYLKPLLKTLANVVLELPATHERLTRVTVNGCPVAFKLVEEAVGVPRILVEAGLATEYDIVVHWAGQLLEKTSLSVTTPQNRPFSIQAPGMTGTWKDPQGVLAQPTFDGQQFVAKAKGAQGHRTFFVQYRQGNFQWWRPVDIHVTPLLDWQHNPEAGQLAVTVTNQGSQPLLGVLSLNGKTLSKRFTLPSDVPTALPVNASIVRMGTNRYSLVTSDSTYTYDAINWNLPQPKKLRYEPVALKSYFNDAIRNIFAYGKYLTPRWPYTTLQVPTQGMGQWCHPAILSNIDDQGLRAKAGTEGRITFPQGIPFNTPGDSLSPNAILTTLWDNYPDTVTLPLSGKASRLYLLVAASTYHMQAHVLNGSLEVTYADGSTETLELILPDNLLPLDQDLFVDDFAFTMGQPKPWRIRLKTGDMMRYPMAELGLKMSNDPITVDGGMATLLDMVLDPAKPLRSLTLRTTANEVIIGLMGATLVR